MTNTATFNKTIKGVRVRTTHLYSKYLTYDKIVSLIVRAMRHGVVEDGVIEYRYTSQVKGTDPYRKLRFKRHWTPGQWLEVVDVPASKSSGFVTVEFENYHLFEEQERVVFDSKTGMHYSISKPEGWE